MQLCTTETITYPPINTVQLKFNLTLACGELAYMYIHYSCMQFSHFLEFTRIFGVCLHALQLSPYNLLYVLNTLLYTLQAHILLLLCDK